jgi:hypothetical protein
MALTSGPELVAAPGGVSKSGFAVRSGWGQVLSSRSWEIDMRVMVLVKVTKESGAGVMPSADC